MTPEHLTELYIALLAAILPAVAWALAKFMVRIVTKAFIEKISVELGLIKNQVTPNGGDSMTIGDRMVRVERHLDKVDARQDENTISVNDLQGKQNWQLEMLKLIMNHNDIPIPKQKDHP